MSPSDAGVSDKRNTTALIRSKRMTLATMCERVKAKMPPGFDIAQSTLFTKLKVKNKRSLQAKRHHTIADVTCARVKKEERKFNIDSHFGHALWAYVLYEALKSLTHSRITFVDDHAKITRKNGAGQSKHNVWQVCVLVLYDSVATYVLIIRLL